MPEESTPQEPTSSGEPDAPPRLPTRRSRILRVSRRTVAAALSVIVLAFTWYSYVELNKAHSITTTDVIASTSGHSAAPNAPTGFNEPLNILLVGLDSRTDAQGNPLPQNIIDQLHAGDNDGELNTDTMILLHVPTDGRSAVAISFPRDVYADIAGGFGKHKLNSAYAYGRNSAIDSLRAKGLTGSDLEKAAATEGRKNLIKTIEQLTGNAITINRYAEINLAGFYTISNMVGGVPVCLKTPVKEANSGIDLPAGPQVIEGQQALAFVRQRYDLPRGDLDRIVRQQAFMSGLAQKILSTGTLTNPSKINALLDAAKQSVVLSQGWDLLNFFSQLQGIVAGSVQFQTIPTGDNVMIGGADVTLVDPQQIHDFIAKLVAPTPTTTPGSPTGTATASNTPSPSTSTPQSSTSTQPMSSSTPTPGQPITAGGVTCVD